MIGFHVTLLRAIWIDLTNDGRQSILAARARRPMPGRDQEIGELVFIERPRPFRYDEETGTPLDFDGTVFDPYSARNIPWKTTVLDKGPDVMFSVADLDPTDDSVEVIASQFFGQRITLHSIQRGPSPQVTTRRVIDDRCGASFSAILANLFPGAKHPTGVFENVPSVVDCGSTVSTLKKGDMFSHILVTSHECSFEEEKTYSTTKDRLRDSSFESNVIVGSDISNRISGGSLFAYRVPESWRTDDIWERDVMATGFRVRGQIGNMINPGAPGFCYTFYPTLEGSKRWSRPFIGIAGDCAEAAYILRPDCDDTPPGCEIELSTKYALMCEIDCGGTVGSLAIGYGDCCNAPSEQGWAKIYMPSYENDKIFAIGMGTGDEGGDESSLL